ncbi:inducible metalloproteinase inhibitor protein-like protein [Leptotrombidium deliense]|uniref:Inducible metalloproteinase inhibitor protein-like protein n=1 Tax=Leptotrombidium deliense TaxID=299467 RepID=A0A443S7J3_9ACAR|nr:inducible metalloproteinase inhibitor protein-like protein [Leptotrombidium deliense]
MLFKDKTKECGSNEVYLKCGTSCPKSCNNLDPLVCDRRCNNGCFCKDGYVLYFDGITCVLPEKCKKKTTNIFNKSKSIRMKSGLNRDYGFIYPKYTYYPYKRYYYSFNQR